MASFNMSVKHSLPQKEAVKRIQTLLGELKTKYAGEIDRLQEQWDGNQADFSLTAKGFSVTGVLTVLPGEVTLAAQVPFAAMFFKGQIESAIREKVEEVLA